MTKATMSKSRIRYKVNVRCCGIDQVTSTERKDKDTQIVHSLFDPGLHSAAYIKKYLQKKEARVIQHLG